MSETGHTGQRQALNVLGNALVPCSYDPVTGWYRDGCCHTDVIRSLPRSNWKLR